MGFLIKLNQLTNMKKTLLTSFLALVGFAMLTSTVYAGIGVTPVMIENNRLRPGTTYSKELVFSQSDPDEALVITLEPDFGDYNDWFTFEPSDQFTIDPGVSRTTVKVNINVPAGAELAPTEGSIRIKAAGAEDSGSAIQVERGVKIGVSLATTNSTFVDFLVRAITMGDVSEDGIAQVTVKVENTGNVAASPSRLLMDILTLDEEPVDTISAEGFDIVQPGETTESIIAFDVSGLDAAEYFADAQVYYENRLLRQERLVLRVPELDLSASSNRNLNTNLDGSVADLNQFLEENRLLSLMLVVLIATAFTALIVFLFRTSDEREEEKKKSKPKAKTSVKKAAAKE